MNDEVPVAKRVVQIDSDLAEIVPAYLENRHKDVLALASLLEQEGFDSARTLGHRMKGSGAGYGFDEISSIGARMELAAKHADRAALADCVAELKAYLDQLEIAYI